MRAIDVNTFFGTQPHRASDYELPTLLGLLEGHGVAAALTLSLRGLYADHVAGNAETLATCRAHPRLLPVATVNPLRGIALEEDVAALRRGGFRAVRVYPGDAFQAWSPESLAFRRLLDHLAPLGLPVMTEPARPELIAPLARATAEVGLPLVLLGTYYYTHAEVAEAARRFPGVYVETSRLGMPGEIALMAREVGVDRLLYGSGMPHRAPQASMNALFQADLSDDERARVLAGNATRLFRLDADAPTPPGDGARFRAYDGPKIDVHAHLHRDAYRFPADVVGVEPMLEHCHRYNLERVISSSTTAIFYGLEEGNRDIAEMIAGHPALLAYVVTNANFLERSAAEMDRYYARDGFVGAKIHCEYSMQDTASAPMRALFREIARRGRPVKIHNAGPGWARALREYALEHPKLPIIIAHGGPHGTGAIVADAPNVYLEFCSSGATQGVIRDALEAVGEERLLFGTDQDLFDPGFILGHYYDAGLTPAQEEKVYYTNARRLFGI